MTMGEPGAGLGPTLYANRSSSNRDINVLESKGTAINMLESKGTATLFQLFSAGRSALSGMQPGYCGIAKL